MTTYSKFKKLLLFPAIFLIMFCITAVAAEKKPVTKPAPKGAAAPAAPAAPAGTTTVQDPNNPLNPIYLDPAAKADDETILDMNILFETKSNFMDNVVFPHYMHSWWLKCEACHQSVGGPIFEMGAGANKVKMVEMADGKWCGRCHGRVAFPLADCRRCHNWPKAKKPDETITIRPLQP